MFSKIRYQKPSQLIENIGLIISLLYAFSRLSWGYIIPSIIWGVVLAFAIGMLLLAMLLNFRKMRFFNVCNICVFFMLIVIIFDNYNRDFGSMEYWGSILPYLLMVVLFYYFRTTDRWINLFIKVSLLFGVFYALMTIICNVDNSIYYNSIYPIMRVYSTSYTPHPAAGFTAHYSTNGIYLAIGAMAAIANTFFKVKGKTSRLKAYQWFYLSIILIALLICGKRGIIIGLAVAVFVAYYNFNSDRKSTRLVRTIGLGLAIFLIVYILSLVVPSIGNMLARFSSLNINDYNVNQRLLLWSYATSGFTRKPLFGNGWRWVMNTNTVFFGADAHNVYIQLLAETGIVGSIFFFLYFVISLKRAMQLSILVSKNKSQINGNEVSYIFFGLIVIIYTLLYMIEGTALYSPECMIPFFLCTSLVHYYWAHI